MTLADERAYERIYGLLRSITNGSAIRCLLERYNFRRPHGSLGHQASPRSRLKNVR